MRSAASAEQDTPSGSDGEQSFRPARLGQGLLRMGSRVTQRLQTLTLIDLSIRVQHKILIHNFCWGKYYHLHYYWSIQFGVHGTGTKWSLNCTLKTSNSLLINMHLFDVVFLPSQMKLLKDYFQAGSCSSFFLLNNTFRKETKMLSLCPLKNYK